VPTPRRPPPQPYELDAVLVITVGTIVWAVALLVALVAFRHSHPSWVWTCMAGCGLGCLGIVYCRRRARRPR
jgi:hypothetical protein